MATLSFDPAEISTTLRIDAAPLAVREASGRPQSTTVRVVVTADPPLELGGVVDLAVVGGDQDWLSVQSEYNPDDAFTFDIDASALELIGRGERRLNAVIRATVPGYTSADLAVTVLVVPTGAPAKG